MPNCSKESLQFISLNNLSLSHHLSFSTMKCGRKTYTFIPFFLLVASFEMVFTFFFTSWLVSIRWYFFNDNRWNSFSYHWRLVPLTVIIWTNITVTITCKYYKPNLLRKSNMIICFIVTLTTHWMKLLFWAPVPIFSCTVYVFRLMIRGNFINSIYHMNHMNETLFQVFDINFIKRWVKPKITTWNNIHISSFLCFNILSLIQFSNVKSILILSVFTSLRR